MEAMLQQSIRLCLSSMACLLFSFMANGQIKNSYNIGSIGMSGSVHPVYSGPVIMDASACFNISNGIKTLAIKQQGVFSSECVVLLKNEAGFTLMAYPNPVTASYFFVKTKDHIIVANAEDLKLELFNMNGSLIKTFTTSLDQLNAGYRVNMIGISNDVYLLKVMTSKTNIQLIKIIKTG